MFTRWIKKKQHFNQKEGLTMGERHRGTTQHSLPKWLAHVGRRPTERKTSCREGLSRVKSLNFIGQVSKLVKVLKARV